MNKSEKQFSFTRAASSTSGRAKNQIPISNGLEHSREILIFWERRIMNNSVHLTVFILLLAASRLSAATLYVSLDSMTPTTPYTSWATAATNIQDAVDAAHAGDTVLVTNGVYAVGSRDAGGFPSRGLSRVTITNSVTLDSVNGPLATAVDGGGSVRCVYLGTNALLSGFTLTNGASGDPLVPLGGGGVLCLSTNAILTNCVLTRNSANYDGGGAYCATLYNCMLTGNSAGRHGGGAAYCTMSNCVLTGNSAGGFGGGVFGGTLDNCTIRGNSPTDPNGGDGGGANGNSVGCLLNNCTLS